MMQRVLLALLSIMLLAGPVAAKVPAGPDWTNVVSTTPAGTFVLGNPKAKVRLVEFGSLTCPHCRAFDEAGVPTLLAKYVRSGHVSWEFRNYVRDSVDLTAGLIARCGGARGYFPLTRALFKDQPAWFGKAMGTSDSELQRIQGLPPQQQFVATAKIAGLDSWARAHGLAATKANQCLSDMKAINALTQMTQDANDQLPDFPGTPTFLINGQMVRNTATWEQLEPHLKAALGG